MINMKLLQVVLQPTYFSTAPTKLEKKGNFLFFPFNGGSSKVHLDELNRLIKDWAWDNAYEFIITRNENGFKAVIEHRFGMDFDNKIEEYNASNNCMCNTELEAVIKAANFVMKQEW